MAVANRAQLSVQPDARDQLAEFRRLASAQTGRDLTVSDALRLAVHVARQHLDDAPTAAERLLD